MKIKKYHNVEATKKKVNICILWEHLHAFGFVCICVFRSPHTIKLPEYTPKNASPHKHIHFSAKRCRQTNKPKTKKERKRKKAATKHILNNLYIWSPRDRTQMNLTVVFLILPFLCLFCSNYFFFLFSRTHHCTDRCAIYSG